MARRRRATDVLDIRDQTRVLQRVDDFKDRWIEFVQHASDEDMARRRDRRLRRHATETGILERLTRWIWAITEALVAEGLTLDAAEREGGIAPDTLETIRAQLDALQFLVSFVNSEQTLSVHFIRSLHAAITRTQVTYDAKDQFGNAVRAQLHHGRWKTEPNHVRRPDGSLLEYTPPIFLDDHMTRLVSLFGDYDGNVHPVPFAAWLHHRFICIHPFADGNGRVARALTLISLLRGGFTPLVVQRQVREEYIEALDSANDGDIEPLVRLFARLEEYALRSEFETPALDVAGSAAEVAKAYAERIQIQLKATDAERKTLVAALASGLNANISEMLRNTGRRRRSTSTRIFKRERGGHP